MIKLINKIALLIQGVLRDFFASIWSSRRWTVTQSGDCRTCIEFLCHESTQKHSFTFSLSHLSQVHVNMCPLPPHLHSCSVPLTRTLRWAEALPFPLWCQNKYHFFIWSCAASWEVALTPAWASPSSPPSVPPPLRRLPIPRWGQEY